MEDYLEAVELLNGCELDLLELNISCPNVKAGGMNFGVKTELARQVVREIRKVCKHKLVIKLSPNAEDIVALARACEEEGADGVSLTNTFLAMAISTHCPVQILSDPQLVGSNGPQQGAFRELNTADFLSRDEVTLDNEKISGYLTGKTVLVTGGGGSIGSELCRQVMRFRPGKLLIFDIYENCAYELLMELQQKYGRDIPVTVLIGSIRDKKRLDEVFETYHPTVVFHAAAHKHVPLMWQGSPVRNFVPSNP